MINLHLLYKLFIAGRCFLLSQGMTSLNRQRIDTERKKANPDI